ncbi:hypothetical protein GGS23DRAFT_596642 [Durotheca rogersii]|uniref:uncharacterized protein n=1 Tax=Durotheca rogersii TaxID=419775 RepID=UPI00221EADFC|nr:uncharacterized protein GGS23DRAFT_596642 [Durotheca rogersii]KAI5863466.1 hypothetical protein GGS23DRAFT_596642 [Durotheca rogersii]
MGANTSYASQGEVGRRLGKLGTGIVYAVHFVASTSVSWGSNHWDIFLQTGESEFISLEITARAPLGREGYPCRLDILHHSGDVPRRSHKVVAVPAHGWHTVADFLDVIVQAGNHMYEFTREGRGCAGWVHDQFYLFVRADLMAADKSLEFEEAINTWWERNAPRGPSPVTHGTYRRDRRGRRLGRRSRTR